MFLLGDYAAALAPSALVVGLALIVLPFCRRGEPLVRAALLGAAFLLSIRYMVWRFAETVPELDLTVDAVAGWSFALQEAGTVASSSLAFLFLSRTRAGTAAPKRTGTPLGGAPVRRLPSTS